MGVGYYVKVNGDFYTDHGNIAVSTGITNSRVGEVITAILQEFKRLKTKLVSNEELKKVKEYLIGNMYLELEPSDEIAMFYGGQEVIVDKMKKAEEVEKEIRKITPQQIKELSNKLFNDKELNMAMIGPFKDKKKFEKIFRL